MSRHGQYVRGNKEYMAQWRAENKQKTKLYMRDYNLRKLYGITLADFTAMIEAQNSKCYICSTTLRDSVRTHLDHNHATKQVRKILCARCNKRVAVVESGSNIDYSKYHPYRYEAYLKEHGNG